ncbi:MAG: hypothetical protein RLZZ94_669 [Bacteroidota bacterium]|jgi:dienelactone hydrolase
MKTKLQFLTTLLFIVFCNGNLFAQQIGHTTFTYTDASRNNRQIQTEIYYPATAAGNNTAIAPGTFPVVVCGHGFVMTTSAYQNIWTALVPDGYIVALPTTEGGFSPNHANFGLDLKFLVNEIKSAGAGTSVPSSSVGNSSAIMGHSMGGGSSFLAAANDTTISTMISFAAANTNPSSISAAQNIIVPTLIFSGTNDCVAPPAPQQDIMYDSTSAAYKTQIYISGGGHCYFADNNFNCSFGEATCSPSPTITRAEQQSATADFLKSWLAYYLKGDCNKAQEFQDSLALSSRITYRQSQSIACTTSSMENISSDNIFSVYPNPAKSIINVKVNSKAVGAFYTINDIAGRIVLRGKVDAENMTIAVDQLSAGLYILNLNNKSQQQFKIIKD